jgi:hypothetical protein
VYAGPFARSGDGVGAENGVGKLPPADESA